MHIMQIIIAIYRILESYIYSDIDPVAYAKIFGVYCGKNSLFDNAGFGGEQYLIH